MTRQKTISSYNNCMSMIKKKTSKYEVIQAIRKHNGMVVDICKELGVTTQAFYKRLRNNEDLKLEFDQARETMIDFCESKLKELIKDGHFPSIQFYLQCIGKHRGWVVKSENVTKVEHTNYVIEMPTEREVAEDDIEEIAIN